MKNYLAQGELALTDWPIQANSGGSYHHANP